MIKGKNFFEALIMFRTALNRAFNTLLLDPAFDEFANQLQKDRIKETMSTIITLLDEFLEELNSKKYSKYLKYTKKLFKKEDLNIADI